MTTSGASARPGDPETAVLELAAGISPGAEGLVMVPYLEAERGPLWDADIPGAYLGLRSHHTRAHLVRAGVEGVCMQMRFILDRLDAIVPVESVRATGGAFRSALWRAVMAAALDRPLSVVDDTEGTARGAAALGLVAMGQAPELGATLAQLAGPDAPVPAPVAVPPGLVAHYRELRRSLPPLIEGLGAVASLPRLSTER